MTKVTQGGHLGSKKVVAFFLILFSTLILIAAVHFYIFKTSDTQYERNIRTIIADSLKFFLSYQQDSPSPLAVNQTIIINDDLIAFTDKLVYTEQENVNLHFRSRHPLTVSVIKISNHGPQTIQTKAFTPSHFVGGVIFNTFNGFHVQDFDDFRFSIRESDAGWIQIEVKSPFESRNIPIFVEGSKSSDVLFVESTDTMKAYISANNLRTYYKPGFIELIGTFTRPEGYPMNYRLIPFNQITTNKKINCKDHLANADFVLKYHLEKNGILFDVASDEFLENGQNLNPYKLLILGAHNEYWTVTKFQNIEKFILQGGSLLILGGNTAFRLVKKVDGHMLIWGNGLLETEHSGFIKNYLGSYYDIRGYDTYGSFRVANQHSDLLPNLTKGYEFGAGTSLSYCKGIIDGASGHETDKLLDAKSDFSVLALGANPRNGGAQIVYRKLPSGGHILNFGSISLFHRIDDPTVNQLIENFIGLVNQPRACSQLE